MQTDWICQKVVTKKGGFQKFPHSSKSYHPANLLKKQRKKAGSLTGANSKERKEITNFIRTIPGLLVFLYNKLLLYLC